MNPSARIVRFGSVDDGAGEKVTVSDSMMMAVRLGRGDSDDGGLAVGLGSEPGDEIEIVDDELGAVVGQRGAWVEGLCDVPLVKDLLVQTHPHGRVPVELERTHLKCESLAVRLCDRLEASGERFDVGETVIGLRSWRLGVPLGPHCGVEDRRPGQVVLSHVIELDLLRQRIRDTAAAPRERELRGSIEQRRKVLGSKPVFSGTRTPVEALLPYLKRRYTTEKILEAFPHLSREDVTAARRRLRELGAA